VKPVLDEIIVVGYQILPITGKQLFNIVSKLFKNKNISFPQVYSNFLKTK
jgi:hypothetical protein